MNVDAAMRDFNPGWAADQARFEDLPAGDPDFDWGLDGGVPCCGQDTSPEPDPSGMEHWPESDYAKWLQFEGTSDARSYDPGSAGANGAWADQPTLAATRSGRSGSGATRSRFTAMGPGFFGPLNDGEIWGWPDGTGGFIPPRIPGPNIPHPNPVDPCDDQALSPLEKLHLGCLDASPTCIVEFDPTPPPSATWSESSHDCLGIQPPQAEATYFSWCADQAGVDTCVRPCTDPYDFFPTTPFAPYSIDDPVGLLDDIGSPSRPLSEMLLLLQAAFAFIQHNADLLDVAMCAVAGQLSHDGPTQLYSECVQQTLFDIDHRVVLHIQSSGGLSVDMPLNELLGDTRIQMGVFPLENLYDAVHSAASPADRLCTFARWSARMVTEVIHVCGVGHTGPDPDYSVLNPCDFTLMVKAGWLELLTRRYPCMRQSDCCQGPRLNWGDAVKDFSAPKFCGVIT